MTAIIEGITVIGTVEEINELIDKRNSKCKCKTDNVTKYEDAIKKCVQSDTFSNFKTTLMRPESITTTYNPLCEHNCDKSGCCSSTNAKDV